MNAVKHCRAFIQMLAKWAEENLVEGCTVFGLHEPHRVRMRMTNGLDWLNKEIKRRARLASMLPNRESCLRLVGALLPNKMRTGSAKKSISPWRLETHHATKASCEIKETVVL